MSTAVRRGMFFGTTVRVGDSLPVVVKNKKTGKTRIINFGSAINEQYFDSTPLKLYSDKNHNDPKRRQNYFNRFSGTKYKTQAIKIERAKGKYTPKLLSHMFLWIVASLLLIKVN